MLTQPPPSPRTLLHGTDAVPLERAAGLLRSYGDAFLEQVADPAEARWAAGSTERLAVLLAVKESGIKAIGGRPPGFSWRSVRLLPDPRTEPLPAVVREVFEAFRHGAGLDGPGAARVELTGPVAGTAARQLGAAPADVLGAACHGSAADHVLAAVCLWRR